MRGLCLILLLVVALLLADCDAGRRRRRRRFFRRLGRALKRVAEFVQKNPEVVKAAGALLGRDVSSLDTNNDGTIDQLEAEALASEERTARDLLSFADDNGDSVVSIDEFNRNVRELMLMDADDLDQHFEDANNY